MLAEHCGDLLIVLDPAATCRPVVANHHRLGLRRPGTVGNADTGGRISSKANAGTAGGSSRLGRLACSL